MANLDFFSVKEDQVNLLNYIFANTHFSVFESSSDFDKNLRHFKTTEELMENCKLGLDNFGYGTSVTLQLWQKNIDKESFIKKIDLNKSTGHSFRYSLQGFGLIQLYFGGIYKNMITSSHFGSFEEKGALKHGFNGNLDWMLLKKEFNIIANYIKRDSKIKAGSMIVMKKAHALGKSGNKLKCQAMLFDYDRNSELYKVTSN